MAALRILILFFFVVCTINAFDKYKERNSLPDDTYIVRPNYGTIFERVSRVQLTTSYWYHTIGIKLPGELPVLSYNLSLCENQDTQGVSPDHASCAVMGQLFRMSHTMADHLLKIAHRQNETLNFMLNKPSKRMKRGLFNFIGEMRSFFEGVATEDELYTFQGNMELIETRLNDITGVMMKGNQELVSYRTTIDTRINSVWAAINETADMLRTLSNHMNVLAEHFNTALADIVFQQQLQQKEIAHQILQDSYMHAFNIRNLHTLQMVIVELESFIIALGKLNEGYLSPYLVSTSDLQILIDYVSETLHENYPSYSLAHTRPEKYYEMKDVISVNSGEYLYIQLRMPLQDVNMHYTLYSVKTIPLSLTTDPSSRTLIETEPFLGISLNNKYYIQPSPSELDMCYGQYFKTCHTMILSTTLSQWSCTLAILFDQTHLIKELCDIQVILPTNNLYTHILDYGNTSLFISTNDLVWSETCFKNVPNRIPSCNMCTITRKCRCAIYGQSFYLAPDIRTCKNVSTKSISYYHHFNLAPLLNVMDNDWHTVLNLSGSLTSDQPVNVPSVTILKLDEQLSKVAKLGGKDTNYHLSLNESLKRLEDNVDLISKPVHLEHLPFWANPSNKLHSGFFGSCIILMTIFSFLVTSCICFNYCKGVLGPTLLASTHLPVMTNGLNLDHSEIIKDANAEISVDDLMLNEVSKIGSYLNIMNHCVLIMLVALACWTIVKAWQRYFKWICFCQQREPVTASTLVHFVIWDDSLNTISFPLYRIPLNYRQISAIDHNINVNAKVLWHGCFPFLTWESEAITVKAHDSSDTFVLPEKIRLHLLTGWQLSRLLLKPHTIQIILKNEGFTHCIARRIGNIRNKSEKQNRMYEFLGIKPSWQSI